ncbi:DUF1361 domain-containing protein [Nocardia cyriacigeorgica]|uniref:Predicted membrane protein n=1 Tax=Nocardia cyriacigeorgica TaxID=135487 RepID=A0A4U8VX19_9NOCA|nr:DUF1361 domain-containing protein [Nocardia cyriacigeorgica]VFA97205.1 Predicted membrane protein [Nocardia cyriacigeorgica]
MDPGGQLLLYAVALNGYALLLIYLRSWVYRTPVYRPMVKNFFLSVLPLILLLALLLVIGVTETATFRTVTIIVGILGFGVWLLALPNSGYLITELNLNHRREDETVPLWYDIIAVLAFAMSGVINTVLGVFAVHLAFALTLYGESNQHLWDLPLRLLIAALLLLVSVGIYFGRYLRLNSWDVRAPTRMWAKLRHHFDSRAVLGNFVLFCATHTIFLWLIYGVVVLPMLQAIMDTPDIELVD